MYKAQLAAALGLTETPSIQVGNILSRMVTAPTEAWRTDKVKDSHNAFPLYEIELEFPVFIPETGELEELNTVLRGTALQQIHRFRDQLLISRRKDTIEWAAEMLSEFVASFEVSFLNDDLVSIRFSNFSYGAGAIHPQHFTDVINYQRGPLIPLTLSVIFEQISNAIEFVSRYCISQITLENGNDESLDQVKEGASPELDNFSKFNLTERGLLITFDEYQVGPYVDGARQVMIPWNRLLEFLNPRCKVSTIIN